MCNGLDDNFTSIGSTALLILNRLQCELRLKELGGETFLDEIERAPNEQNDTGADRKLLSGVAPVSNGDIQSPAGKDEIEDHSIHHAGDDKAQEQEKPADSTDAEKDEAHRRFVARRIADLKAFERRARGK